MDYGPPRKKPGDEAPKDATDEQPQPPHQPMTLGGWIILLAWLGLIAGVAGSIVLAIALSEETVCDRVSCETENDGALLIGLAVAGVFATVLAFVQLLAIAETLRHLSTIVAHGHTWGDPYPSVTKAGASVQKCSECHKTRWAEG